jgi:hypothetical protein
MSYSTVRPIGADKRAAIAKEAQSIERDWWCESFIFIDARRTNGRLIGNTKLEVVSYSSPSGKRLISVDNDDDTFMASRDATFIVSQLADWSKAHKVTWSIEAEAWGVVGRIKNGEVEAGVTRFLRQLREMDEKRSRFRTPASKQERALAILKKHAARNADTVAQFGRPVDFTVAATRGRLPRRRTS